jgi:hypothetical protein
MTRKMLRSILAILALTAASCAPPYAETDPGRAELETRAAAEKAAEQLQDAIAAKIDAVKMSSGQPGGKPAAAIVTAMTSGLSWDCVSHGADNTDPADWGSLSRNINCIDTVVAGIPALNCGIFSGAYGHVHYRAKRNNIERIDVDAIIVNGKLDTAHYYECVR